jgi:hypothetical protein
MQFYIRFKRIEIHIFLNFLISVWFVGFKMMNSEQSRYAFALILRRFQSHQLSYF